MSGVVGTPKGLAQKGLKEVGGPVVHPEHYNACGEKGDDGSVPFEPIKVIESWGYDWGFCMGNGLKYILRAPHKGSERQDLEKALWYLKRVRDSKAHLWEPEKEQRKDFCDAAAVCEAWSIEGPLAVAVGHISLGNAGAAVIYVEEHLEAMQDAARVQKGKG